MPGPGWHSQRAATRARFSTSSALPQHPAGSSGFRWRFPAEPRARQRMVTHCYCSCPIMTHPAYRDGGPASVPMSPDSSLVVLQQRANATNVREIVKLHRAEFGGCLAIVKGKKKSRSSVKNARPWSVAFEPLMFDYRAEIFPYCPAIARFSSTIRSELISAESRLFIRDRHDNDWRATTATASETVERWRCEVYRKFD